MNFSGVLNRDFMGVRFSCGSINGRERHKGVEQMAKINGKVMNMQGELLENAEVLFVDRSFEVITSGYSNDQGEYYLQVNERTNGMVMGTYSYGEKYLGFTFANINSSVAHHVDITLGNVEFIHFTRVINKDSTLFTYQFQLASLEAMKINKHHISPAFDPGYLKVTLENEELTSVDIRREQVLVGERNQWIDQYTLSFKGSKKNRGQVLRVVYNENGAYGIIKTFL